MLSTLFLLLFLPQGQDSITSSWDRFRGPNGSGQGTGFAWPAQWDTQAIRWKVELPGTGNGSPVIYGGKIFIQASGKDGKERTILCLNTTDGRVLWKKIVSGKRASSMHKKNSLASGSGACNGEHVFFCHWDGESVHLAAYRCIDGTQSWTVPLGRHSSQHGAGHSPIVVSGKVILANESDDQAEVVCVEASTGKTLWTQKRKAFRASYCTPLIHTTPQGDEVVVVSTAGIAGYQVNSGKVNWEWTWPFQGKPLRSVSSPILTSSYVLLASAGDGGGDRDSVAVQLPTGDTTDTRHIRLLWQLRRDMPYVTCFLEHQQAVFYVADKGVASCMDLQTGTPKWSQRLAGNFTSSPILIDGKVICVNEEGELFIFDAKTDGYHSHGRLKLGEGVLATPALADGMLFIRGHQHLFCIGAAK